MDPYKGTRTSFQNKVGLRQAESVLSYFSSYAFASISLFFHGSVCGAGCIAGSTTGSLKLARALAKEHKMSSDQIRKLISYILPGIPYD